MRSFRKLINGSVNNDSMGLGFWRSFNLFFPVSVARRLMVFTMIAADFQLFNWGWRDIIGQGKNATSLAFPIEVQLLFLNKCSPDFSNTLINFQNSENIDSAMFAIVFVPFWRRGYLEYCILSSHSFIIWYKPQGKEIVTLS